MYRTRHCGELRKGDAGTIVTVCGWVHTRRDHGGLIFLDVRDASGIAQVRVDPKTDASAWKEAEGVRSEFVVQISGNVVLRPEAMRNEKLPTGDIELEAKSLVVLNKAKTPPFPIDQESNVREDVRLRYRYLDLRRTKVKKILSFRSRFVAFIRQFLLREGFEEIETPILGKSTPEGARDYLVPSRVYPGRFYALPQSPQQYKQLLMVGGIEKYFQIAPCFRDEDGRAERSPDQFYQLDLEMAFCEQGDILTLMERLLSSFINEHMPDKRMSQSPWPRFTYADVMTRYGTDKPDIRFGMELHDVTEKAKTTSFAVFQNAETVLALSAPAASTFTRKTFDELTEWAKAQGAKGLAWAKVKGTSWESPVAKFVSEELQAALCKELGSHDGHVIFFVADEKANAQSVLGGLRVELANRLNMTDPNTLAFCFVVDFPLFEPEKVDGHFLPMHHMFTRPKEEDVDLLETAPEKVLSWQHDLVLNGVEVGGGSLRIYTPALQEKIFSLIGFSKEQKQEFSHMLEAFTYGAPPHGGIAPGIDRLVMVLLNEPNVREVVAFPKSGDNRDLLLGAPSEVEPKQLRDLHIKIAK